MVMILGMVEAKNKHNTTIIIKNTLRKKVNEVVLQEEEGMTNPKFIIILIIRLVIIHQNIGIMILTKLLRKLAM